jgi:ribonuclease HI
LPVSPLTYRGSTGIAEISHIGILYAILPESYHSPTCFFEGEAAIGYMVEAKDWSDEGSDHLGKATNNEAEYRALIQGLELASEEGCTEVEARGDSEVIVKQVRGEYGVNQPELRPLRNRVQELADGFEEFEIQHIPREENWKADELVDQVFSK